jgi:hypothetical protein
LLTKSPVEQREISDGIRPRNASAAKAGGDDNSSASFRTPPAST